MHAAPNNALYNNQLSQAIQQVDANLSSGDEQLCDWTQALPDDEAADILVEYTPNNELNSLLGYIARYLNGDEQDISLRELTDRCITAQTTREIQTQQDEQQKQNAWHKMVRHYHTNIIERDY
ncbi:hypothetical protein [Kingella oralis]|uniref:hypothetical protein n=1 Tax=Kingella oralis TaxID=505 RepID=UPI002060215A|nr:MAG TPA: hypothetical protein [Caudoviricetes sp.]